MLTPLIVYMSEDYPSIPRQVSNLTQSAFKIVREFTKTGNLMSPPTLVEARTQICSTCQHYDLPKHRCKECGCHLANKINYIASDCPLGFW